VLEQEGNLSSDDRKSLVRALSNIRDESTLRTYDNDVQVSVGQLAGVVMAFLGDGSRRAQYELIPRNTALFPDLADYATLWLGDDKSIRRMHDRMFSSQMWTLYVSLPLMKAVVAGATPRLHDLKARSRDSDTRKMIDDVLQFHKDIMNVDWIRASGTDPEQVTATNAPPVAKP
jgi:hypothetical protein